MGLPPGISMPPPMSPLLDRYFRQMMGIPSKVGQEAGGNQKCKANEELFEDLCYMQCKYLTNGTFALRTSAWTCCRAHTAGECFVSNQGLHFGFCSGYDVGGDGRSCPHLPGDCLDNEEMFLGQCYEKCSILTNGQKPHRTSPISCCETSLGLSCFMPGKVVVGHNMNTAGGAGDGDASTPANPYSPHLPNSPAPSGDGGIPIAN